MLPCENDREKERPMFGPVKFASTCVNRLKNYFIFTTVFFYLILGLLCQKEGKYKGKTKTYNIGWKSIFGNQVEKPCILALVMTQMER